MTRSIYHYCDFFHCSEYILCQFSNLTCKQMHNNVIPPIIPTNLLLYTPDSLIL